MEKTPFISKTYVYLLGFTKKRPLFSRLVFVNDLHLLIICIAHRKGKKGGKGDFRG